MQRFRFDAIGTSWEIDTESDLDPVISGRIIERADAFDRVFSRFRADSLIGRIASALEGGRFQFPDDATPLFDLYDRLHRATDGAVDPLVGRDLELLGYDRDYTLQPDLAGLASHAQTRPCWTRDVIRDSSLLETDRALVIDVGAAGKGYLVDIISAMLVEAGHRTFVVDGSGDMRHFGDVPLDVSLEHPQDPALVIGTVRLSNRAICASSSNRRAWGEGLHHVVDARTGTPVRNVAATWVAADDAMTADGLATALFFSEPDRLGEELTFEFARMFDDGRAEVSADFEGRLFT